MYKVIVSFLLLLFFAGCSKVPLDDCAISECVQTRIGKQVFWGEICSVEEYLDRISNCELSADHAVQIALFQNPEIQAVFENLGIAHADLVQAGLFRNPFFDVLVRFPNMSGFVTNIEYSAVMSFLDFFLVPLRKKVAVAEFEKIKLEVSHAILDLSFDVEQTYFALIAEKRRLALLENVSELAEAAFEVATAMDHAGNVCERFKARFHAESQRAKMEAQHSKLEVVRLENELYRLLGFECCPISLKLPEELQRPSKEQLALDCLESKALSERLDLLAMRWQVEQIARTGALRKWWAYTDAMFGIAGEREPDGLVVTGPAFAGQIPIFDYGQADRARLSAILRQMRDRYLGLRIAIINDVKAIHENLETLRVMITDYENRLLPAQAALVWAAQRQYNVMTLGTFDLIDKKKEQYGAEAQYIHTLRDYWIRRVHLKRAVGGQL